MTKGRSPFEALRSLPFWFVKGEIVTLRLLLRVPRGAGKTRRGSMSDLLEAAADSPRPLLQRGVQAPAFRRRNRYRGNQ